MAGYELISEVQRDFSVELVSQIYILQFYIYTLYYYTFYNFLFQAAERLRDTIYNPPK